MNSNIKVALIGTGNICLTAHAPILKKLNADVKYAVDIDNKALLKIKGIFPDITISNNLESVDWKKITCAIVTSPTALHFQHVKSLLSRNIHVLCEKPLATTSKEAQELADITRNRNLILQVGYYRRFHTAAQYIKKIIMTGNLGKLQSCVMLAGHIFSVSEIPPSLTNKKLSGGGCTMDFGVHTLDLLSFWFDRVKLLEYYDDSKDWVEANAFMRLESSINSNVIPTIILLSRTNNIGYVAYLNFEKLTVAYHFNTGYKVKFISPPVKIFNHDYFMQNDILLENEVDYLYYFEKQWLEFTNRINGLNDNISSLDDAILTTSLAEACYQNKKELKLPWENIINKLDI